MKWFVKFIANSCSIGSRRRMQGNERIFTFYNVSIVLTWLAGEQASERCAL